MRASIRSEEPLMTKPTFQASREAAIRNCPVCVSGLLTVTERDRTLDIYTCIACGTSVSLRHPPSACAARCRRR
jgi:hypothetical protein